MPRSAAIADEALAGRDIGTAAQAYGHVLQDFRSAKAVRTGGLLPEKRRYRRARHLALVRPDGVGDEAIRAWKRIEVPTSRARGEVEVLRAKLAADENDHQARFDLALALDAGGDATRHRRNCWNWCAATANGMRTPRASAFTCRAMGLPIRAREAGASCRPAVLLMQRAITVSPPAGDHAGFPSHRRIAAAAPPCR